METHEILYKLNKDSDSPYFAKENFNDWLALPDGLGGISESLLKYAAKTEKKWLALAKNTSLNGFIASVDVAFVNGEYFKISGLIRKGLWDKGLLEIPDSLTVCVYALDQSAYDHLISVLYPVSLKNMSQVKVLDCYKRLDLSFNSTRLKHGYITDAINIALRGETRALQDKRFIKTDINIDRAIDLFKDELIMIDNIKPDSHLFSTGIIAAALLMLSINPKTLDFFISLNTLQGESKGDRIDPVEALLRIIEFMKKKSISEGKFHIELCAKTIRAIQAWDAGPNEDRYWLKRLNSVDFLPDIRKMKSIKEIHGVREL